MVTSGPTVLLILDGASEPAEGEELTSLERATTPVLDALAQLGSLHRLATSPPHLPVGSETGCALLLGWQPPGPVDRAHLEALARGIELAAGEVACRIDVHARGGRRASAELIDRVLVDAAVASVAVHRLAGHRLLLVGAPDAVERAAERLAAAAPRLRRWPAGTCAPMLLDARTLVIGAPGAVTGLARGMGAAVITPPGITGGPADALDALAAAALTALRDGAAERVVVHVGGPDEAAHAHDAAAKVRALEAADLQVVLPLTAALHELSGRLEVAIDHGCDPRSGEHDGAPTPFLRWDASDADDRDADDVELDEPGLASGLDPEDLPVMALPKRRSTASARTGRRLTERWAEPLPVEDPLLVVTQPARAGDAGEGARP